MSLFQRIPINFRIEKVIYQSCTMLTEGAKVVQGDESVIKYCAKFENIHVYICDFQVFIADFRVGQVIGEICQKSYNLFRN